MKQWKGLLLVFGLASMVGMPCTPAETHSFVLTVEAGASDRRQAITPFRLPPEAGGAAFQLVDSSGNATPVQHDGAGNAWFILDALHAGASRTYRLEQAEPSSMVDRVEVEREGGALSFLVQGRLLLRYQAGKVPLPRPGIDPIYERGGYIHPVLTPSGTLVTDDYPPNHLHHHGIWAAWTKTVFEGRTPDFWNMGYGTGTVEPVALDTMWSGPVHGGLRARNRYVDLSAPEPKTVLNEAWVISAYNVDVEYGLFDLEVTQEAATDSTLYLPEYHYGGVGFRGHRSWNGADSTFFLTSEDKTREDGHATRARWCHIGGYVDGHLAGIAILGHPDNFEAPQPMRIHPDEPFFNYAPSQAGDWSIPPDTPYVARYRFVVADGPPDAELLDRLWNDYAAPPVVTVSRE